MASNCLGSEDRWIVRTTEDAVGLLVDLWGTDSSQERLVVMLLDGEHVLGTYLHDFGVNVLKNVRVGRIVRNCQKVGGNRLVIGLFLPDKASEASTLSFKRKLQAARKVTDLKLLYFLMIYKDRQYLSFTESTLIQTC